MWLWIIMGILISQMINLVLMALVDEYMIEENTALKISVFLYIPMLYYLVLMSRLEKKIKRKRAIRKREKADEKQRKNK